MEDANLTVNTWMPFASITYPAFSPDSLVGKASEGRCDSVGQTLCLVAIPSSWFVAEKLSESSSRASD